MPPEQPHSPRRAGPRKARVPQTARLPRRAARARPWTASRGRAAAALAARERAELARGVRFRSAYLTIMGVVLAVAALNVLLGAFGLVRETRSRPLTDAERARYVAQDVARRWQAWPAGMVFPEELPYTGLGRTQQYARRVGIAPEAACGSVVDAPVAPVLGEHGCRTLLRATYVDQTATFAVTVGVAVMPSEDARTDAAADLPVDDRVGVRPVSFPGTVTDSFGAAQRQRTGWVGAGPYIVFLTVGYTDGRTRASVPLEEQVNSEMWPLAQTLAGRIARALGEPPDVPRCTQGNVC
ncbi:hypothetical protein [Microbispora amethystogenes]|uniref:MacB-like periplasmic core domain-containing protein n=1 Tax=Microbispora amethystogenes TaxID=1427754 RepID=A0ABQ4FGX5_9ACTN|nr:hypothetical protein [Microbispora amethystogenes]GIH34029.1 hypothetical protein Mam01_41930 [Microbispora amethystogenes]